MRFVFSLPRVPDALIRRAEQRSAFEYIRRGCPLLALEEGNLNEWDYAIEDLEMPAAAAGGEQKTAVAAPTHVPPQPRVSDTYVSRLKNSVKHTAVQTLLTQRALFHTSMDDGLSTVSPTPAKTSLGATTSLGSAGASTSMTAGPISLRDDIKIIRPQ